MKVYVDGELPKSCANCFNQHCRIGCKKNSYEPIIKKEYLTSRPKECPLHSLSDYTKQVRKEVCEEVKKKVLEYFNVKNEEEYENSLSLLDALFTADVVFEILDKIGEKE